MAEAAFAAGSLTGTVRDRATNLPIAGASVRVQASGSPVLADAEGRYVLPLDASGVRVTAAAKGYFTAGRDAAGEPTLDFFLDEVAYDASKPVDLVDPSACAGCHTLQVAEWRTSAMAHAGKNTWVEDLYSGKGTKGGLGGFVYTRDSVHAGKNPTSECASCHQPESWIDTPFTALRSKDDPHPSVERGVSCLTCHLVAHIDESKPNDPGIFPGTVRMQRGAVVRYGVLGDVDYNAEGRMRASYQPQLSSAVCAACHQDANDPKGTGVFDGPISEPTYLEWLASPYGDPKSPRYTTCMGCHSEASPMRSASALLVTEPRPAGQVRTHSFEGTTPSFLERAVSLSLDVRVEGSTLHVQVSLTNTGAGHHVPTGVTMRNAILIVEAKGKEGALEHLGTAIVSELGGVGNPENGYFSGLPGKVFTKLNETASGEAPTFFTEAVRIRADNRIPALATDTSSYPFRITGDGPIEVRAKLIYRRALRDILDAKGWTEDGHGRPLADLQAPDFGHVMAHAEHVVDRPSSPVVEPDPVSPETPTAGPSVTGGCQQGPSSTARGPFALVVASLLARRARRFGRAS